MKKLLYVSSVIFITQISCVTTFAYYSSEYYSAEQFRMDIKSHMDYERNRQESKDFTDRLNSSYENTNRQYDLERLQDEARKQEERTKDLKEETAKILEAIDRQEAISKESAEQGQQICKQIKSRQDYNYEKLGITIEDINYCIKYGVQIKLDENIFKPAEQKIQSSTVNTKKFQNKSGLFENIVTETPVEYYNKNEIAEIKEEVNSRGRIKLFVYPTSTILKSTLPETEEVNQTGAWSLIKNKIKNWFHF